jgi:menaquinone-9 beta-reductase
LQLAYDNQAMKKQNTNHYDFIIVGAGPAGLILGIELRRQNYTVLILEKQPEFSRTVCGEYLTPEGLQLLHELDLPINLNQYERLYGMQIFAPNHQKVVATFPEQKYGLSLNRLTFNRDLALYFEKLGGEIKFGQNIETIINHDHSHEVQTTTDHFQSLILIGADGRHSKVAKMMGYKSIHKRSHRIAIHCYLKPKQQLSRMGQMHILPDGSYIGIDPIKNNEVNFSIVTDGKKMKDYPSIKDYLNNWIMTMPSLSTQFNLLSHEEIKIVATINNTTDRIVGKNFALIGDASGFIDPLTGEGITNAIKTARLLSQAIKNNPLSITKALMAYQVERKTKYREKEKLNDILQVVIKYPSISNTIALILNSSQKIKSLFIGVIANIYNPKEALNRLLPKA